MIKTRTRLSDGRELIYYDRVPQLGRDVADQRAMTEARHSSHRRYDPFQGSWVIYASHRQGRMFMPLRQDCPLCPSEEGHLTEIPADSYEIAVFENRFASLASTAAVPGTAQANDPLDSMIEHAAGGRCEVVSYTSDHDAALADLSPDRTALLIEVLADRTAELAICPGVEQVFCFENCGAEIGVTLPHPHGQIYAYPFVTPRTERALLNALNYRLRTGRNLFDDRLALERASGARVIASTGLWTALVPHAARWPYEVHLYPNERVPDLTALSEAQLRELPTLLLDVFGRFKRLFDQPAPYIAAWHQAPVRVGRDELALHLEIFTSRRTNDKLKYLAGSESGMDVFANDVLPETAAAELRTVAA